MPKPDETPDEVVGPKLVKETRQSKGKAKRAAGNGGKPPIDTQTQRKTRIAWGMTPKQVDDFYEGRWKEWAMVAHRRDALICMHTDHQGIMKDLMERLIEDPWWILGTAGAEPAPIYFDSAIPYDDIYFKLTGIDGLLTPTQLLGPTGFGRMNAKAPTRDGVRPWETAVPDADAHSITPDDPDNPVVSADDSPGEVD